MAKPANYNGQLNSNEIFAAIYNMIISQQVFADNIKTSEPLVAKVRTDGTLYGDTKLYYSTDVLYSSEWGNDAEAANLLQLHRPEAPEVQAITIDKFRQIRLTVDNYLSKRAFSEEGTFSSFNSVMLGWMGDTKKVFDNKLIRSYFGTHETSEGKQNVSITLPVNAADKEAENRLQCQTIAQEIADIFDELTLNESRDYNDYGNLRSYDKGDLMVVWNNEYLNKFRYIDMPTIFHKEGLEGVLTGDKIVSSYFGTPNAGATAGALGVRSLIEQVINGHHYFPGDEIKTGDTAPAGTSYTVDDTIICKIVHKDAVKFMSAFQVSTSFFNARALCETHFLTFGYSEPAQLFNYPFITLRGRTASK